MVQVGVMEARKVKPRLPFSFCSMHWMSIRFYFILFLFHFRPPHSLYLSSADHASTWPVFSSLGTPTLLPWPLLSPLEMEKKERERRGKKETLGV